MYFGHYLGQMCTGRIHHKELILELKYGFFPHWCFYSHYVSNRSHGKVHRWRFSSDPRWERFFTCIIQSSNLRCAYTELFRKERWLKFSRRVTDKFSIFVLFICTDQMKPPNQWPLWLPGNLQVNFSQCWQLLRPGWPSRWTLTPQEAT